MITAIFVYGTLKRDQCRGTMWPCPPSAIRSGYVRGQLFDLGSYPALRCDDDPDDCDWVAGELWTFTADTICETITQLDRIEETNQPLRMNLYDRILVRVHPQPASPLSVLALAYQYSNAAFLSAAPRIRGRGDQAAVAWPTSLAEGESV